MTTTTNSTESLRTARPEADPSLDKSISKMLQAPVQHDASDTEAEPKFGYMLRPEDSHPDSYGLIVDENGAGVKMPPGSTVIVEPVPPSGRDFCVAYFVSGNGPSIWQIGESFEPDFLQVNAASEVHPMIEVFDPVAGRRGQFDAQRIAKLHRVQGVYIPADVMDKFGPAPADLPLMSEAPEGCLEHYVRDATNYPVLREGDIALIDIGKTELTNGALVALKWKSDDCSLLQTNYRKMGLTGPVWAVDPLNRPPGPGMMERRQKHTRILYASDGPYTAEMLQEKIVGTVIGILQRSLGRRAAPHKSVVTVTTAAAAKAPRSVLKAPDAALLALAPKLLPMLDALDTAWAAAHASYEASQGAFGECPDWEVVGMAAVDDWRKRWENSPEFRAYRKVRRPADKLDTAIAKMVAKHMDVPAQTLDGLLLKQRIARSLKHYGEEPAVVVGDLDKLLTARLAANAFGAAEA